MGNKLLLFYLNVEYNCFQARKDEISGSKLNISVLRMSSILS